MKYFSNVFLNNMNHRNEQLKSPRAKYRLTYEEYNCMVGILREIREGGLSPELLNNKELVQRVTGIIQRYFPEAKGCKLASKDKSPVGEVYAFKIGENRPEIYILNIMNTLTLVDQYKCEMYQEAPFNKPDWEKIKMLKDCGGVIED